MQLEIFSSSLCFFNWLRVFFFLYSISFIVCLLRWDARSAYASFLSMRTPSMWFNVRFVRHAKHSMRDKVHTIGNRLYDGNWGDSIGMVLYAIHLGPIFRVKNRKCTFNIQTTGINGLITVDCMRVDYFFFFSVAVVRTTLFHRPTV